MHRGGGLAARVRVVRAVNSETTLAYLRLSITYQPGMADARLICAV